MKYIDELMNKRFLAHVESILHPKPLTMEDVLKWEWPRRESSPPTQEDE